MCPQDSSFVIVILTATHLLKHLPEGIRFSLLQALKRFIVKIADARSKPVSEICP